MSCGTECITKLLYVSGDGGRKIDVRVVAGDRNTYPPHSRTHTVLHAAQSAGNSHKAQLPINCIRRFDCAARALVFASLERRSLSLARAHTHTHIKLHVYRINQLRASLFTPMANTMPHTHTHGQTEEKTMSRKRPLIVDDQQWCICGRLRKWKPGVDFQPCSTGARTVFLEALPNSICHSIKYWRRLKQKISHFKRHASKPPTQFATRKKCQLFYRTFKMAKSSRVYE